MSSYYYGGILLPEIPADKISVYPYWVVLSYPNGNKYLVGSKSGTYFDGSSAIWDINGAVMYAYKLVTDAWVVDNQSEQYTGWSCISGGTPCVAWSNHNIANGSSTSTEIYVSKSQPTLTKIRLVNQWQNAVDNGYYECPLTISGCTVGNILILTYAVRGSSNTTTLSDGWTVIGGGNVISGVSGSYQRVFFAYKFAAQTTEQVTITQTASNRVYVTCSEYANVTSVVMRNDLAAIGASDATVSTSKTGLEDVMVYGVSSAYYTSGRLQAVTPDDLTKVEGSTAAERLACWFDGGLGSQSHTFSTYPTSGSYDAIVECIQLFATQTKYLVKAGGVLYSTANDALSMLPTTELTANAFMSYGSVDAPSNDVLLRLTDPEVFCWQDDEKLALPAFSIHVTGLPVVPYIIITDTQDMSHESILGINSVTATVSDDVLLAVTFNNGATWKKYDGSQWADVISETDGMTAVVLNAITSAAWAEITTGTAYKFRFVLPNETSYITSVIVDYLN